MVIITVPVHDVVQAAGGWIVVVPGVLPATVDVIKLMELVFEDT